MTSVTNRKRRRKIWTSFVQGRRECNTKPIKPGAGHATSANRNRKPHRRTLQHDLHSAASETRRSGGSKFASNPKPALWGHFRRNRAGTKAGAPMADGRWRPTLAGRVPPVSPLRAPTMARRVPGNGLPPHRGGHVSAPGCGDIFQRAAVSPGHALRGVCIRAAVAAAGQCERVVCRRWRRTHRSADGSPSRRQPLRWHAQHGGVASETVRFLHGRGMCRVVCTRARNVLHS